MARGGNVTMKVRIANAGEIRRTFAMSPRIMGKELETAIKKVSLFVEGESKKRTPVKTSRLRTSHRVEFNGTGLAFAGTVGTHTNYDSFVHDGTRVMKARPFMQNAVDDNDSNIQNIFRNAVTNAMVKIVRGSR